MLKSDPEIMDGKVCFSGTRIPISSVWQFAAVGYSAEQIAKEYPSLSLPVISAAMDMVEWA